MVLSGYNRYGGGMHLNVDVHVLADVSDSQKKKRIKKSRSYKEKMQSDQKHSDLVNNQRST